MKDIVSNCFLCGERSLHVAGTEESQVMQCIHCGYVSSTKYIGTKETNEEFQKLGEDMKKWAKEENGRIWIPTVLTLPVGMLYPIDDEDKMKWSFAPMVEISQDEKEKYKNSEGGYYEKRIDVENPKIYDEFFEVMLYVNEMMKANNGKT
jgi:ribosomal protein L37E|tara:strand:+ start:1291 stop:1740 length:450 start_codon:yes stop_codon:yes gene_type:complete